MQTTYRTQRFRAFGCAFTVTTNSRSFGTYLDELLAPMTEGGGSATEYALLMRGSGWVLLLDGEQVGEAADPSGAVTQLLWHVNHEMIRRTQDLVLVHAAGAEYNGVGVVLPAPMESGKSTLVAGLVAAGFGYLTDEAVGIDPVNLDIHPYPKPLSLDPGSWSVLADLEPAPPYGQDAAKRAQWHLSPFGIRPDAVAVAVQPGFVIAPRYEANSPTQLRRMGRGEMLTLLGECAFRQSAQGRATLAILASLVRRCECYRLQVGQLNEAVAAVQRAVKKASNE